MRALMEPEPSWQAPDWQPDKAEARTHVLVIGVGDYPYLPDRAKKMLALSSLGARLTTSVASTAHFVQWVLAPLRNDAAPLGSLDVLLSAPEGVTPGLPVPAREATADGLRTAFRNWYRRCSQHHGNVAIFYYVGHGLTSHARQVITAQEFGRDDLDLSPHAFDIKTTIDLMRDGCPARVQCYFIDACRPPSNVQLDPHDFQPLLRAPQHNVSAPGAQFIAYSVYPGTSARGIEGQPTAFTRWLVRLLNGEGGTQRNRCWEVTTETLPAAIRRVAEYHALDATSDEAKFDVEVTTAARPGLIALGTKPQTVPLRLGLSPEDALALGHLALREVGASTDDDQRGPAPEPWETRRSIGYHQFWARFASPAFVDIEGELFTVDSPMRCETFEVASR